MSSVPLISIVMNCFNGQTYLRKALDSILDQTYQNWELIFWDNKSEDKSVEIFKNYKDKRFKFFSSSKQCRACLVTFYHEACTYIPSKINIFLQ